MENNGARVRHVPIYSCPRDSPFWLEDETHLVQRVEHLQDSDPGRRAPCIKHAPKSGHSVKTADRFSGEARSTPNEARGTNKDPIPRRLGKAGHKHRSARQTSGDFITLLSSKGAGMKPLCETVRED
jgi:hypothetical protein